MEKHKNEADRLLAAVRRTVQLQGEWAGGNLRSDEVKELDEHLAAGGELPTRWALAKPASIEARAVRERKTMLSGRELHVLAELSQGYTYTEAASLLRMSINTLREHVRSIYRKWNVHSLTAALATAREKGVLK